MRNALQASENSKDTAKIALDKVYHSLGDITSARSIGQLSRQLQDLNNARRATRKDTSIRNSEVEDPTVQAIWKLLEKDLKHFCTDPNDFWS